MTARRRYRIALLALYAGLSILITEYHARHTNFLSRIHQWRMERHEQILSGEGRSPWTYRLLVPAVAEVTAHVLAPYMSVSMAREWAYVVWRAILTLALLLLFHAYLAHWLEPAWSLAGTLFVAGLHFPSFESAWFHLNFTLDFALWTAGALLALRGRTGWLYPLVALAALNRATSLFVVLVHAAIRLPREPFRRVALRSVALGLCWAVPTLVVRLGIGIKPWAQPVAEIAARNLEHPSWWLWVAAFLGAFWVLPFVRFREMPPELRWMALALAPYLLLQLVFGRIIEARLFLPLALPLVPMGLLFLRDAVRSARTEAGGDAT